MAAFTMALCACDPAEYFDDEPTEWEQRMIPEEMTWTLDSLLVITNYNQYNESREMFYPSNGLVVWSYTFYPYTYHFPDDLFITSEITEEKHFFSKEYDKDYCKFTCTSAGELVSAGYVCYYKNFFTFNGLMDGGWMVYMIREAGTNWDAEVWTSAFNSVEYDDGTVAERRVEFYSRTK